MATKTYFKETEVTLHRSLILLSESLENHAVTTKLFSHQNLKHEFLLSKFSFETFQESCLFFFHWAASA